MKFLCLLALVGFGWLIAASPASAGRRVVFGLNDDRFGAIYPELAPKIAPLGNIHVGIWRMPDDHSVWPIPPERGVLLQVVGDSWWAAHPEEYAVQVRRQVLEHPNVKEVQVWNEPDLCNFPCEATNVGHVRFYGGSLNRYLDLLAATYRTLSGTGVKVLGFGFSSPFRHWKPKGVGQGILLWYKSHGTRVWHCRTQDTHGVCISGVFTRQRYDQPIMDGLAYHPYCGWQPRITRKVWRDWSKAMSDLPGGTPHLWFTESGLDTQETPGQFGYVQGSQPRSRLCGKAAGTEADQAIYIKQLGRQVKHSPYIDGWFNFLLSDEPDLNRMQTGLFRPDWSPKPAYEAYMKAVTSG